MVMLLVTRMIGLHYVRDVQRIGPWLIRMHIMILMTKLEHCQKCGKQIEFFEKGKKNVHDDKKSEMNKLESSRRSQGCDVYTHWYCDDCWGDMEDLLQDKGFLPPGFHGFDSGDEDNG